ncbi:NAD(P)/FAD-dependent oxidoreductase [Gracilibacillus sp. Marseille-QA3620]
MKELFDITIIGGGPAGLYSAFYSGLREMKTKIIECQNTLGGKVRIYPEKMIWDVGGLRPVLAHEFCEDLIEQGLTFHPAVCLNQKVERIEKEGGLFVITASDGEVHYSKAVILANGGGIISPQKLEVEDAHKYELTNLHYTVGRIDRFRGSRVLISGGGNTAVDWAVELMNVAKNVTVVYRKEELSAHEAQVKKLRENGVAIILNGMITRLYPNEEKDVIAAAAITVDGVNQLLEVDDVLINHGYHRESSVSFAEAIEPRKTNEAYFESTGKGVLSVEGLFAAGDNIAYDGKVYMLLGAFQDAVNAVNSAKQYIDPSSHPSGMVSSHNEVFKTRNEKLIKERHAYVNG